MQECDERVLSEAVLTGLRCLYQISGIPFLLMRTSGEVVVSYPEHLEQYYNPRFWTDSEDVSPDASHNARKATIIEIGRYCCVALARLDDDLIFCTVPIRQNAQVEHNILPAILRGFSQDRLIEFFHLLLDVPVMSNYELSELASLARQLYCGEPTEGIDLRHFASRREFSPRRAAEQDAVELHLTRGSGSGGRDASTDLETALMSAIRSGDLEALRAIFRRPARGGIGRMSLNDVRQARYEFVCMMYAASRAAIEGGVSPETSLDMSDYYCQRMDAMTDTHAMAGYLCQCLEAYCSEVAAGLPRQQMSTYTRRAQEFIGKNLYMPLSVEQVSKAVGLNRRSLGSYFVRDTGIGIAAYVWDRRLSEAAYLLRNSDMDILSISTLLQFSSQSWFTTRFKARYGMSPLQYRLQGS